MAAHLLPALAVAFLSVALAGCWPRDISAPEPVPGALAAPSPPKPSTITVPVVVALADLQAALETAIPKSEAGFRPDPLGGPIVDDALSWSFQRQPIAVAAQGDRLIISTAIGGTVRVAGRVQPVGGDVGDVLDRLRLNPAVPFSAHADLAATATLSAAPVVRPDWTVDPQLAGGAQVTEARIPVAGITALSVKGEVQPKLDQKVAELVAGLNRKIASDGAVRNAVARAWTDLCRAHPVSVPAEWGGPLFLVVEPVAAHVAAPRFEGGAATLVLGITAVTRLTDAQAAPACRPLPPATPAAAEGFALELPVVLSYPALSRALTQAARRAPATNADGTFQLAVEDIALRPAGTALAIALTIKARETRWLGATYSGTVHLRATPRYDPDTRTFRLADIRLDPGTDAALADAGIAQLLAPLLVALVGSEVAHPLAAELDQANAKIQQAVAQLRSRQIPGLAVTRAETDGVRVDAIDLTERAVVVRTSAQGTLAIAAYPAAVLK